MTAPIPPEGILRSARPLHESILRLCRTWAQDRSKDPNTKVGAAVYDPVTGGIFLGYNGFPAGMPDQETIWNHRPANPDGSPDMTDLSGKYARVIHAERNAIKKAALAIGENVSRCELFVTHYPCRVCMLDWIIAFGIRRVFFGDRYPYDPVADALAGEAQVMMVFIDESE